MTRCLGFAKALSIIRTIDQSFTSYDLSRPNLWNPGTLSEASQMTVGHGLRVVARRAPVPLEANPARSVEPRRWRPPPLRTKRGRYRSGHPFRDAPGSSDRPTSAHLAPPHLTSGLGRAEATYDTAFYCIIGRARVQFHSAIVGARTSGQGLSKPLSHLNVCNETEANCSQVNGTEYRYTEHIRATDNWDRSTMTDIATGVRRCQDRSDCHYSPIILTNTRFRRRPSNSP
jgi:hypothetical protein